jgi:hypothetical protein
MNVEKTDEPVKVRADFGAGGEITPLLLRRGERVYRVSRVNGRWEDREGLYRIHCFSLSVDSGDIFQVAFRPGEACWRLTCVAVGGT